MDNLILQFSLVIIITFFASFIQRVSGFGFGIFAMTFLPYIMSAYTEAHVPSSMLSLLLSLAVSIRMFRNIHWKNIIFPLIGSMVFTFISVSFMKGQADTLMRLLLGIALILLSLYFLIFSGKIHIRPTWYGGLVAGSLSGILGGLFSMGGPPVVIYYMESEKQPVHYMATIQAYFTISNIYSIGVKVSAGFVTSNVLACFAIGLVGVVAGLVVGSRVFDKMDGPKIKKAVYIIMALSGVANIVTTLV